MSDFIWTMVKPLLACLILTGIHTYLGLHIVERKVIFVDLALAQVAALGAAIGMLLGFELHGVETFLFALVATFAGAFLLSFTRVRREHVPQEALIGIIYAVTASLSLLVLSRSAHGDEEIRHMLVGNILLVGKPELIRMTILYSIVGVIHWIFRKRFFLISTNPTEAEKQGISVRKWDILFYITFGFVVTSSVPVAGVLLVFALLVVPATASAFYLESLKSRLIFGWIFGTVACLLGIAFSYAFDFPTGSSVVVSLGLLLSLLAALRAFLYNH